MNSSDLDITRLALHSSDGVGLRAERLDGGEAPRAGVVLCHPHPLHGGNMYSHVIGGLFNNLPAMGVTTLRFNFRGTSGSEGRHDGGQAEQLDVRAAIDHLCQLSNSDGDLPIVIVGYSFGALVGLSVSHPSIVGWVGIAPPLSMVSSEAVADPMQRTGESTIPKTLIIGTDDDFCPPQEAENLTAGWANTTIVPLAGENHFLATAGPQLQTHVEQALSEMTDQTGSSTNLA